MSSITLPYNYMPRWYQIPLYEALDSGYHYAAIVWHRRSGKDLSCWNYTIKTVAKEPMDAVYVFPTSDMGKDNLWEAKTNDGTPFLDFIPPEIRRKENTSDDGLNGTSKQAYLWNGSIIKLRSGEKPNRLRGGNPKLFVLSEFAEMDPAVLDVIEPIVEANGGLIIVNFTPKGDNHAKGAWNAWQKDKRWFTHLIRATDTDVFSKDQLERIRESIIARFVGEGRSEIEAVAFFDQEYMCSFESPVIGSYFGEGMRKAEDEKRICNVPVETTLPIHTVWDLGVGDSTAIWFYQEVGQEIHFIDYYETSGEGLPHYATTLQEKRYLYGGHTAPHDIEVRELGSGKSRKETAASLGINFRLAPSMSLEDGIEASRNILNKCWFDKEKCARGIKALKGYCKEWDDKNMTYKNHPKHDWTSHGADAFRYFAVSFRKQQTDSRPPAYQPADSVIGI